MVSSEENYVAGIKEEPLAVMEVVAEEIPGCFAIIVEKQAILSAHSVWGSKNNDKEEFSSLIISVKAGVRSPTI